MKLQISLVAIAATVLGIAACAAPADEQGEAGESLGQTSQELCRIGTCDTKRWGGLTSSSGGVFDPGTGGGGTTSGDTGGQTFSCTPIGKECIDPGYRRLSCSPSNPNDCVCMIGCGGSGWPYGTFNPCPSWTPRYTCNSLGSCRCY